MSNDIPTPPKTTAAPSKRGSGEEVVPFGAGLIGALTEASSLPGPGGRPSPSLRPRPNEGNPAAGARGPGSRAPEPRGDARSSGRGNLIMGRWCAAIGGTDFKGPAGGTWPRSGATDLQAALVTEGSDRGAPLAESTATGNALDRWQRAIARAVAGAVAAAVGDSPRAFGLADGGADVGQQALVEFLSPDEGAVMAALQGRLAGSRTGPEAGRGHVLDRPSWVEPIAQVVARWAGVLVSGQRLIVLSDPEAPGLHAAAVAAIESVGAPSLLEDAGWIQLLHDDGRDVLRAAARAVDLGLRVLEPFAGPAGAGDDLRKARDAARREEETAVGGSGAAPGGAGPWFGTGAVPPPAAPLEIRGHQGAVWTVGAVQHAGGQVFRALDADDLDEAAIAVFEGAFGPGALGGVAMGAASRVVVERRHFSSFTGILLEILEEAEADDDCVPPAQLLVRGSAFLGALQDARRLGLDEGATLIYERGITGRGRRKAAGHGLLFTNVERRMRLGSGTQVPGVLCLCRDGH